MAISTQIQNLNLIPGKSAPVVVHLSQGNVGDTVKFYLYDGDNPYYPNGVTIAVHGIRSDGTAFGPYAVAITGGSNLVSFDIVSAMTSVNGAAIGELVISDSNENQVGSANFGMLIEETPYSSSVTYEDDLSIYQRILAYVQSFPATVTAQIDAERTARMEADSNIIKTINADSRRIVVIGDSWSDTAHTTYTKWPNVLQSKVGWVFHNYAQNGSTVLGADNYAQNGTMGGQVAEAIADTSYDHDEITDIIIMGGVNDYRSSSTLPTPSELAVGFDTLAYRLQASFKYARVYIFLNYQLLVDADQFRFMKGVVNNLHGVYCRNAVSLIGWVHPLNFISDYVHPDNAGYIQIASNVLACLNGGVPFYTAPLVNKTVTSNGKTATIQFKYSYSGLEILPSVIITTTGATTGSDNSISISLSESDGSTFGTGTYGLIPTITDTSIANKRYCNVFVQQGSVGSGRRLSSATIKIHFTDNATFAGNLWARSDFD